MTVPIWKMYGVAPLPSHNGFCVAPSSVQLPGPGTGKSVVQAACVVDGTRVPSMPKKKMISDSTIAAKNHEMKTRTFRPRPASTCGLSKQAAWVGGTADTSTRGPMRATPHLCGRARTAWGT